MGHEFCTLRSQTDSGVLWLQEEEAMLSEMEVTGQAFEDMQEQNVRLLQQLREKDDANFKLMSEVCGYCWSFIGKKMFFNTLLNTHHILFYV